MAREDYGAQVEAEFLEEAQDTTNELQITIGNMRSGGTSIGEGTERVGALVARLNLLGAATDFPLLDLALRRFSDYMRDLELATDANMSDLETFIDVIGGLLAGEIEANTDTAEFYRSLPTRRPLDLADLEHLNIEILLVEPQRSSAAIIARELQNCGYKVTTVKGSIDALDLVVRTKPDLVISSAVLDVLSGIDLACALAAMPATSNIPFCILTSFDRGNAFLSHLPDSAGYLRKGSEFGTDFAVALRRFGII
ncbi:MAG: response regulator [Rhodospirillum sp.]|nr:response regulator [Rhodospirillum sp.]MCF8491952.1 response regulator [Rhodospirillum sp.]MCF8501100.1 response regulator [Rhodospirillum sp.]